MYNNYKTHKQKFQEVLNYIKTIDQKLYTLFSMTKPYEEDEKVLLYCTREVANAIRNELRRFSTSERAKEVMKKLKLKEPPTPEEIKNEMEKIMEREIELKEAEPHEFLEFAEELVELGYITYIEKEDIETIRKEFSKKGYSETCLISLLWNFRKYIRRLKIQNPTGFILHQIKQGEIEKYIPQEVLEKERQLRLFPLDIETFTREEMYDLEKQFPVERYSGFLPIGILFKGRMKGKIIKFETAELKTKSGEKFKYIISNTDGIPGPLAHELRRALTELYFIYWGPLIRISAYELCKMIGRKPGLWNYENIERELNRMMDTNYTIVFTKEEIKRTDRKRISIKPVVKAVRTITEKQGGRIDKYFEILLSPEFVNSIESREYYPVNRALFFKLKNKTAKRIYEIISPKLYGRKDSPYLKYDCDIFCSLIGIKVDRQLKRIKESLTPALEELQERGIIKRYEFSREGKNKIIKLFP